MNLLFDAYYENEMLPRLRLYQKQGQSHTCALQYYVLETRRRKLGLMVIIDLCVQGTPPSDDLLLS